MPTYFDKTCLHCGKTFKALPRDKHKQFCNSECFRSYRTINSRPKLNNCLECDSELQSGQYKFCGHSCAAIYNNKNRSNNGWTLSEKSKQSIAKAISDKGPRICYISFCKTCGVLIKNLTNRSRRYCNLHCRKKSKNKKEKIISGPYSKLRLCSCKICNIKFVSKTQIQFCEQHKNHHSNKRIEYRFQFNLYDYPDLFNLDLLKKEGFYGPGGKSNRWNKSGLSRDHKVSISDAIKNNHDKYYISHPCNCELMPHTLNDKKKGKSSITYEELVKLVNNYDSGVRCEIRTH